MVSTPLLCQASCNTTSGCLSFTWHPNTSAMNDFKLMCFGRTTDYWQPLAEQV
jgi:hypothetical protein